MKRIAESLPLSFCALSERAGAKNGACAPFFDSAIIRVRINPDPLKSLRVVIKPISSEFRGSYPKYNLLPEGEFPEVALVGRSNVGKSSLLNALVNRKSLARVGAAPGVTRMINLFDIVWRRDDADLQFVLTDLPGYGFAQVSQQEQALWAVEYERYLMERQSLKLLLILVDCRRELKEEERWFINEPFPFRRIVVGTKVDKLRKTESPSWKKEIEPLPSILVSADKKRGIEQLREEIWGVVDETGRA
jgi:GTP-binding protein